MEYYITKLKHKNHKNFIEFLIILQSDKTMSQIEESTKELFINVKDLSFKADQLVVDLMRYLTEALPQLLDKLWRLFQADIPLKSIQKRVLS